MQLKCQIRLKKGYTRDTTLLLQQLFPLMVSRELPEVGWKNPYGIASIHHMSGGVSEIWENVGFLEWFRKLLLAENKKGVGFYQIQESKYVDGMNELQKYWKIGYARDVGELKKILDTMLPTMFRFFIIWWTGMDERTPAKLREKTLITRQDDSFWDSSDQYIRKSLVHLYPQIDGYEVAVLRAEIENPPRVDLLQERIENVTIVGDELVELGSLSKFEKNNPRFVFLRDSRIQDDSANKVSGTVASKGYARGKVRILRKITDMEKVEVGDVIVSPMTTPNYLPAMYKAAAYVTDEGGLLCHAAIVARELNKPCIIGTKFATEVFKDGDVIELDTEQGIVRIV